MNREPLREHDQTAAILVTPRKTNRLTRAGATAQPRRSRQNSLRGPNAISAILVGIAGTILALSGCDEVTDMMNHAGQSTTDRLIEQGFFELRNWNADDAVPLFSAAIRREPEYRAPYEGRAEAYFQLGAREAIAGNDPTAYYTKALADRSKVVELAPTQASAYRDRGTMYSLLDRENDALADYEKALEIEPDHLPTQFDMAVSLDRLGRLEEALVAYIAFRDRTRADTDSILDDKISRWLEKAENRIGELEQP